MYPPDGLLTIDDGTKHDVNYEPSIVHTDPFISNGYLDDFPPDDLCLVTTTKDPKMNTSEDEPASGVNGRLRPRKSAAPSPQGKTKIKPETKASADKPKRTSTPSKAPPTKQDDLATKSDLSPSSQFLCPYCDRTFASRQAAGKHSRRVHYSNPKQDTFLTCLFCNHTDSDAGIIRHMVDSHPNQYFACLDCHARLSSTSELAEHKLNVCEKQKVTYRIKPRQKLAKTRKTKKPLNISRKNNFTKPANEDFPEGTGFNGIVYSCELKPAQDHDGADIEDSITTNLILPPSKNLGGNAGSEKNAVIVLDDIQWNKRIPPNFAFHNSDPDQILSRLGVVHRSPRTGESTRKDWYKALDDATQKFEKCFDTKFYSKVASNVQENLAKFLDGSFNFNPDPDSTIKTRKTKNNVLINTAEGFPILLASEQYSRSVFDSYMPRAIAPKHKWKWDNLENDRSLMTAAEILKRDSHTNNCIITLVSSLDMWTQLSMRRKFDDKFNSQPVEKKTEKQNIISKELKEILESRDIPTSSQIVKRCTHKPAPRGVELGFPESLGLVPAKPTYELRPAVLSGEWVRPRCLVCCACGEQSTDSRGLTGHITTRHPNASVQCYEIVGEALLNADILKHLYVPPSQVCNRTRPPRGFRECTKCNKSVTLEDLHAHMVECAGDTPAVRRRQPRARPFGVRRRRARIPDDTIRKKIRKDIRTRRRQKTHIGPRPRIRTEVGDAETIRKMLADLPAKRHRVLVNPLNPMQRPRRKLDLQRNKLLMRKRSTDDKSRKQIIKKKTSTSHDKDGAATSDDQNKNASGIDDDEDNKPLKPKMKPMPKTTLRRREPMKRQTVVISTAKRKSLRAAKRKVETVKKVKASSGIVEASGGNIQDNSIEKPERVDTRKAANKKREHASSRGSSNNRDDQRAGGSGGGVGGGDGGGGSDDPGAGADPCAPQHNAPLKHSIARLTANSETHDKSVQFHHSFLVQQECNNTDQHGPAGQRAMFENEAVVSKLDKPPLNFCQKGFVDLQAQKNKANKPRKKLNDCIAMLKNKLVEPEPCPITGYVSVQCGSDEPIDDELQVTSEPTPGLSKDLTVQAVLQTENEKPREKLTKTQDLNEKHTTSPIEKTLQIHENVSCRPQYRQETTNPIKHNLDSFQMQEKAKLVQCGQEVVNQHADPETNIQLEKHKDCVPECAPETLHEMKPTVEITPPHGKLSSVPNYEPESSLKVKPSAESFQSPDKVSLAPRLRQETPRNVKQMLRNSHLQDHVNYPQYNQESYRNLKHGSDSYMRDKVNMMHQYTHETTDKIKQSPETPHRQEKNNLVLHRCEASQKSKQYIEHIQFPENLSVMAHYRAETSQQHEHLLHRHEAIRNLKQNPEFIRLQQNLALIPQYDHRHEMSQTLMHPPEFHYRQERSAVHVDCDTNTNIRSRRNSGHSQSSPNVRSRRNSGHSSVSPQFRSNNDPGHNQSPNTRSRRNSSHSVSPQIQYQESGHSEGSQHVRSRRDSGHNRVSPQIWSHDSGHILENQNVQSRQDSCHSQVSPQIRSRRDSGHNQVSPQIRYHLDSGHSQDSQNFLSPPIRSHHEAGPSPRSRRNSAHSQDVLNIRPHHDFGLSQMNLQTQFHHDLNQNQDSQNIRPRHDSGHSQVNLNICPPHDPTQSGLRDCGQTQVSPSISSRRDSAHRMVSPQLRSRHDSGHSLTAEKIKEIDRRKRTEMYNETEATKKAALEIETTWPSSVEVHPAKSVLPSKHTNSYSDNSETLMKRDLHTSQNVDIYADSRIRELPTNIPPAHASTNIESIISAPLDLSSRVGNAFPTHLPIANRYDNYETLDLSNKKPDRTQRVNVLAEEDIIDLRVKSSHARNSPVTLDLCVKPSTSNSEDLTTGDILHDYPTDLSVKGKEMDKTYQVVENVVEIQDLSASKCKILPSSNLNVPPSNHYTYTNDVPEDTDTSKKNKLIQDVIESTAESKDTSDSDNKITEGPGDLPKKASSQKQSTSTKTIPNIDQTVMSAHGEVSETIVSTTQTVSVQHHILDKSGAQSQENKIYDPTLKIPQIKTQTNVDGTEKATPLITEEQASNSTEQVSSTVQDQNMSKLPAGPSEVLKPTVISPLTSVVTIQPIPGRVLTTSNNKIESTTPVYTLANACIPVTKESSNAAVLTSTLLSVPGSTIASTTPVYTLTGTTMNAHAAAFNNELVNGSTRSQSYLPSFARRNEAYARSDLGIGDHITKNMQKEEIPKDLVAEQDPETAKKIAMLPKELVDILGNMPIDHRNQLLNVLPQYVSTTVANYSSSPDLAFDPQHGQSEDKKHSMSYKVPPPTSLHDKSSNKSQHINADVHLAPIKSRKSSNEEEKPKFNDGNTSITDIQNNHDRVIDLTEDDNLTVRAKVDVPRIVTQDITTNDDMVISSNKKRNNNKTSSLRAVRIKAPSLRHKEIQHRDSVEKVDVKNIYDVDVHQSLNDSIQSKEGVLQTGAKKIPDDVTEIAKEEQKPSMTVNVMVNNETAVIGTAKTNEAVALKTLETSLTTKEQMVTLKTVESSLSTKEQAVTLKTIESSLSFKEKSVTPETIESSLSTQEQGDTLKTIESSLSFKEKAVTPETIERSLSTKENDTVKNQHISEKTLKDSVKDKIDNDKTTNTSDDSKKVDNNDHESINDGIISREEEDDSEDDIILAAIAKQKQKKTVAPKMTKNINKEKKSRKVLSKEQTKIDGTITGSNKARPLDDSINIENLQKSESSNGNSNDKKARSKVNQQLENSSIQLQSDVKLNITIAKSELTDKKINAYNQNDSSVDYGRHGKENNDNLIILRKEPQLNSETTAKTSQMPDGSSSADNKQKCKSKKKKRGIEASRQIIEQEPTIIKSQTSPNLNMDDQTVVVTTDQQLPKDDTDSHCENTQIKDCNKSNLGKLKSEVKRSYKNENIKKKSNESYSKDDLITESQEAENTNDAPLRRSRRGKSLFTEEGIPALESVAIDSTADQKGPITKKQLIFSKLLDEEKQLSLVPNSEPEVTSTSNIVETPISDNIVAKPKETCTSELVSNDKSKPIKRKKSPLTKRKNKKKKSIDDKDEAKLTGKPNCKVKKNSEKPSEILVSAISKTAPSVEIMEFDKTREKLPKEGNDTIDHKSTDEVLECAEIVIDNNKRIPLPDVHNTNNNQGVLEKRKIPKVPSTIDFEQSPKPKKTKFHLPKETDSNEMLKTNVKSTKLDSLSSEQSVKSENLITTCYDVAIAAKRTRSKSVVEKLSSADLYDPYNIDFDDMIQKPEPLRKFGTKSKEMKSKRKISSKVSERKDLKTEQKRGETGIIANNVEENKSETSLPIPSQLANDMHVSPSNKSANDKESKYKISCVGVVVDEQSTKNNQHKTSFETMDISVKDVVSDSDESSKSDEPLKKYVEGKVKKMAAKSKPSPIIVNTDVQHKDKPPFSVCKKVQRSVTVKKNVSNEMEEQMRSEQFMESFGFFSERKPRKSNLLATKKISETFHIIAEGEDYYSGSRSSRKSLSADSKKLNDGSHIQPSPVKKNLKRGRKKKDKEEETKIVSCFCKVCKKEFRRPDNFVRHQMTFLHIMKIAEVELKMKAYYPVEKPNYLIAYKQHMDRLKILTEKAAKQKKNSKVKIVLPGLREILEDVNRTIRDQQSFCHRGLSRDEALFIDCCELLKESRRPVLPVLPLAFMPSALPSLPGSLESQSSLPSTSSSLPSTSRSLPQSSSYQQPIPSNGPPLSSSLLPMPNSIPTPSKSRRVLPNDSLCAVSSLLELPNTSSCTVSTLLSCTVTSDLQSSESNFEYVPKAIDNNDLKSDDDVDSVTAKSILESEEVRFLENDLITNLKEAANAKKANKLNEYREASCTLTIHPHEISSEILLRPDCHIQCQQMKPNPERDFSMPVIQERAPVVEEIAKEENGPVEKCISGLEEIAPVPQEREPEETNKTKKYPEYKEKMYPDIIEDIDMFEDKFDKIKRKCRSQAAAAKQVQSVTEPSSGHKGRKKSDKKKGKKISKKNCPNTVLTKGALKGFDGIKVSIPTSDINMSAIVPPQESSQKKKKKNSSKKKREKRDSETIRSHDSDQRKDGSNSQSNLDVYEFLDNEDAECFELRPSTLMERFKNINKEAPSTTQADEADNSSESASDGDDFVYMSDDYVCSEEETENSLQSCELGNIKSDAKKQTPLKRKETVEKSAVMGKIFKHNAVRAEKKPVKSKETAKPQADLDEIFDRLLVDEQNSLNPTNESDSPKLERTDSPKQQKCSPRNDNISLAEAGRKPRKKSLSTDDLKATHLNSSSKKLESEHELLSDRYDAAKKYKSAPSTSKQGSEIYGPSTSSSYNAVPPMDQEDTPPRKRNTSPYESVTSPKIKSQNEDYSEFEELPSKKSLLDKIHDMHEADNSADFDEYTGVARHRARRKCTVGKQNVLAETWSSESEPDGLPPRPTSAESMVTGAGRKKKGRKRDGQQAFGRRGKVTFNKKQDSESRVTSNKWSTPGSSATSYSGGGGEKSDEPCPPPAPPTTGASDVADAVAEESTSRARPRPAAFYWSSEADEQQQQPQPQPQHGWIVGNSHKRLVTMLAHAKGRKRNNDDKRNNAE